MKIPAIPVDDKIRDTASVFLFTVKTEENAKFLLEVSGNKGVIFFYYTSSQFVFFFPIQVHLSFSIYRCHWGPWTPG